MKLIITWSVSQCQAGRLIITIRIRTLNKIPLIILLLLLLLGSCIVPTSCCCLLSALLLLLLA